MLRFLWLTLSVTGWGLILVYLPRMPTYLNLIAVVLSIMGYMYGWVMHKWNWLIYFFTACLWTGIYASYEVMSRWDTWYDNVLPITIPAHAVGKVVLIATLFTSSFLTFADYRVSLNFIHRRGNFDKEQLVKLHNEISPFKKWFRSRGGEQEIRVTLGKEIPFKDN